jgi:RNA polymerase sigma-70 factor (ECF subfamily)
VPKRSASPAPSHRPDAHACDAHPCDADLVARAVAGERAAQRTLYDRHRPTVDRLVRAFATLDPDEADDVVQEAFVRAFAKLSRLEERDRFAGWLLAIARNRALSRLSRLRSGERLDEELAREVASAAAVAPSPADGDWDGDGEAELELVRRIVAELPDGAEKETVRLFYVDGKLSAREIAARLGVGKSAVTMRLERFRAKVKRRIVAEIAALRARGGRPWRT